MQAQTPITITDILATVDPAARHPVPVAWQRKPHPIRPVTVREIVRAVASHPTLSEIIDPTLSRETAGDLIDVLGAPGIVALASAGTDLSEKQLAKMPIEDVLYVFLAILELSFPSASTARLFPESKKATKPQPKRRPRKPGQEDRETASPDSNLVRMVKDATEYTLRTGRDGFELSPAALGFAVRIQADVDRRARIDMVHAVAAAMGDKDSAKAVGEL